MSTNLEKARALVATAEAALAASQLILREEEAKATVLVPKEPTEHVVTFRKYFGVRIYNYAAIRVNGLWYVTGRRATDFTDGSTNAKSWSELMAWLAKDADTGVIKNSYKSIKVMTEETK